jgi:hypothetical protein
LHRRSASSMEHEFKHVLSPLANWKYDSAAAWANAPASLLDKEIICCPTPPPFVKHTNKQKGHSTQNIKK